MSLVLQENCSLRPYNSFGVEARARALAQVHDEAELREALAIGEQRQLPVLLLGGGSNLLLTQDLERLVIRMESRGRRLLEEHDGQVLVEAEAGENWHELVCWTLEQGLGGLENLSLIPGTVGAAPVQNIGAYGVELKDVFAGLDALDLTSGERVSFAPEDCDFAYRDSLFKRNPGRWAILRVRFRLSRQPALHLDYGPVRQRLADEGVAEPTARDVSRVICAIRREKLPDPAQLGNAGSFFENPLVEAEQAERLRQRYPQLVAYPQADGRVKLAAGWLIEQAGWKGYRDGDAGVHQWQALVLVNHGQATGRQLLELARCIRNDIEERFGVTLKIEPNVL